MKVKINDVPGGLVDFSGGKTLTLEFENHKLSLQDVIVFPGIFNAHEHLDFNLFPLMGDGEYEDYVQWGADIHKKNNGIIDSVLGVPNDLRIRYGILKNLINGVTHITHHGGHHDFIRSLDYPVFLNYQYLHSLKTEPYWKFKLNIPSGKDVMIHIGEGRSRYAQEEIDRLIAWNMFKRSLIGIHAISMTAAQSRYFEAIVWCPASNMNLYGSTANVKALHANTTILFGTDSTLTGTFNFWEHLRLARSLNMLPDLELFDMVTDKRREIFWKKAISSFVVARKKSVDSLKGFFELNPDDILLVAIDNVVRLVDESVLHRHDDFLPVRFDSTRKLIKTSDASVLKSLENYPVPDPLNISLS